MIFWRTFGLGLLFIAISLSTWWVAESRSVFVSSYSYAEAGFEEPDAGAQGGIGPEDDVQAVASAEKTPSLRVGIQAGHFKNHEVPEELSALKASGRGAVGGGTDERTVVLSIAKRAKAMLEEDGIEVDLLPATVPPGYRADAFVSLHADSNRNEEVEGFKAAAPEFDSSGNAGMLRDALTFAYGEATGLSRDEANVTERMRWYYAFNWRKYRHAIHPSTPGVILETGYLTSPRDRIVIVHDQERAARGVADGIRAYLIRVGRVPTDASPR